jgi:hypothetical protein
MTAYGAVTGAGGRQALLAGILCGLSAAAVAAGRRLRHGHRIVALSRGRPPVDDIEPAGRVDTDDVGAADGAAADVPAATPLPEVFDAAPAGPGGAPDADPVALLTAEEVSAAFGRPFGPPRLLTPDHALPFLGVRICEYVAAGQDRARLQIQTVTGRIARAMLERVRGEPLPGIGEEAYLRGDTIAILQSGVGIAIRAQHVDGAITRAALRQLAVTAAARLPTSPRGSRS